MVHINPYKTGRLVRSGGCRAIANLASMAIYG
jgi:hypothetical protein